MSDLLRINFEGEHGDREFEGEISVGVDESLLDAFASAAFQQLLGSGSSDDD